MHSSCAKLIFKVWPLYWKSGDCVNEVNGIFQPFWMVRLCQWGSSKFPSGWVQQQHMSIVQLVGDPKFDCWIGRMWWNIWFCKWQWQSCLYLFQVLSGFFWFCKWQVLSGFWVLASVLRFFWFSCLYLFQVLKCQVKNQIWPLDWNSGIKYWFWWIMSSIKWLD